MIYSASPFAVVVFIIFVLTVLGLSFYFARQTGSSKGYYTAGGTISWPVNGVAFAGDYLSAASFLGICGMIATAGYDGFLYSIGYLAGWVVALFVVAEPMKRLGKYTFTDALDSKFNSKGIQLAAGISSIVVSVFYLIPQMVGAGALVTPLLGLPHYVGVIMVGSIVIVIVATAGMKSTTYVQFLKGGLLIIFSTILVFSIVGKGLSRKPSDDYHNFLKLSAEIKGGEVALADSSYKIVSKQSSGTLEFLKLEKDGVERWWQIKKDADKIYLLECLSKTKKEDGSVLYNGEAKEKEKFYPVGHLSSIRVDGKEVNSTGKLGPLSFFSVIKDSTVVRFPHVVLNDGSDRVNIWYQEETAGSRVMRPGLKFKIDKGSSVTSKLNFVSLMLSLFLGTAALPHVLIRYYTVPSPADARKSTIVAIGAIGLFYVLTLYMGIGAMVNGVLDVESSNMAAPLLAKTFGVFLFAVISAIAFATVLGTVSGLIVAASGAVAHDLMTNFLGIKLSDAGKVKAGKISAVVVGVIAIMLGILFKGMNVSFLVGLAFAIAASANLPAIIMILFWKKTTAKGVTASVVTGMVSALSIILLSPSMFSRYGLNPADAVFSIDNPGIISIPLSFLVLIFVSLMTQKKA